MNIYAVKITNMFNEPLFNRIINYLPEKKQQRIRKFRKVDDAQRALLGELLARINICKKIGIKNEDIFLEQNQYGKPFLKGFNKLHFNISHSYEWVVCAFHELPIGIDIEFVKPIDFKIAKRFYTQYEYNELLKRDGAEKLNYFYDLWTLKESYIKAIGKGLAIPLNSFSFRVSNASCIQMKTESQFSDYYFKQYNIDPNYKMAVCSCNTDFPKSIIFKEISELFKEAILLFK